jgi:hypothetical protein
MISSRYFGNVRNDFIVVRIKKVLVTHTHTHTHTRANTNANTNTPTRLRLSIRIVPREGVA